MVFSLRLSSAAVLAAAVVFVSAPLFSAGDAAAQAAPHGPSAPKWDKKVRQYYSRGNPGQDLERAKQRLYSDPLRKFGLPENKLETPHAPAESSTAPPTFDPRVSRLDSDRDGAISRAEYFRGRSRPLAVGSRAAQRQQAAQRRLDMQFRDADRNGDGKITPDELQKGARF